MAKMMINRRVLLSGAAIGALGISSASAQSAEIYLNEGGVFSRAWDHTVDGHDVVAYFDLTKGDEPVKGQEQFSTIYKNVSWLFSTEENLEKFLSEPDRYRPQFGGYCAWAMARNKLARGAPDVWYVYGGKLYLNISARYQREWLEDVDGEIVRGEANWPGILDDS